MTAIRFQCLLWLKFRDEIITIKYEYNKILYQSQGIDISKEKIQYLEIEWGVNEIKPLKNIYSEKIKFKFKLNLLHITLWNIY